MNLSADPNRIQHLFIFSSKKSISNGKNSPIIPVLKVLFPLQRQNTSIPPPFEGFLELMWLWPFLAQLA